MKPSVFASYVLTAAFIVLEFVAYANCWLPWTCKP